MQWGQLRLQRVNPVAEVEVSLVQTAFFFAVQAQQQQKRPSNMKATIGTAHKSGKSLESEHL